MESIWNNYTNGKINYPTLLNNIKTSTLIIGSGITGILIGYLLKKRGINNIIIESNKIASRTTLNTTAKITSQHGLIYNKLINKIGKEKAYKYLHANQNAIKKYKEIIELENIDCDFCESSAFVYSKEDINIIESEIKAVNDLGFNATFESQTEIPIKINGAIKFKNQAHFNPIKFLNHISKNLKIYENTPAISLDKNKVHTPKGDIRADNIIIATHFPFINSHGLYFLKMYQERSYVLALKNAQNINNMYIDAKDGGLSFRGYKDLLLLGGGGHRTGEKGGGYDFLLESAKNIYKGSKVDKLWATQDCITLDGIPYIGKYSKNLNNIFVATGFNKWGMTSSMVSAEILADMIMGKQNIYEDVFSPQRFAINKKFFVHLGKTFKNFIYPSTKRCSHLGCSLKYNKQEHSWDCACHGSRFSEKGKILNNPAMKEININ